MTCLKAAVFFFVILVTPALWAAESSLLFSRTLGGSTGSSVINAIATDPSGNIIAAGTTSAFDFPVTNGSTNSGTEIEQSMDSGNTWAPLSNLPAGTASVLALGASTPPLLFAGGTSGVFRSADGGKSWVATASLTAPDCNTPFCGVRALAADPVHARTLYAGGLFGLFKTTDGGTTWQPAQAGITMPAYQFIVYIAIDPFHPSVIYTAAGLADYRSSDGGASWSQYSVSDKIIGDQGYSDVSFDPLTPGRIYHSGPQGLYVSTDGGQSWTRSTGLAVATYTVTAAPATPGVAYTSDRDANLYGTSDGGQTWKLLSKASYGSNMIALDPFDPPHIIAGYVPSSLTAASSVDFGQTWSPLSFGRPVNQVLFDPHASGHIWAATSPTYDAFVAKLDATGTQILFATYFGGRGNDTVSKMALDAAGNIYITGTTTADFPATPGAALASWSDPNSTPLYVAKFDPIGNLVYATYVNKNQGFAVSPDGSAVLTGDECKVAKLAPDGRQFLFSETLGDVTGVCQAAAVSVDGIIVVGGRQASKAFPVTSDALQPAPQGVLDAVLAKLDPSGKVLYATYLGGPATPGATFADSGESQISAISFDAQGNIVLAGSTGANFLVTQGAYQSKLNASCAYPSSFFSAGFFSTEIYLDGDVFVTRLDPSGASILSSTLLGGACDDRVDSIDVDAGGNVWLAGFTDSNPFPQVVPFATGPSIGDYIGKYSGYVANFDASGDRLLFSSYIDAPGSAVVASDRSGGAWVGAVNPLGSGLLAHIGPAPANPLVIISAGNSYTGRDGPLAPGELAAITLAGFQPDQPVDLGYTGTLPTTLAGAQVLFDGETAALAAVVPGRIYCVTPYDLAGKTSTTIQVNFHGQVSTTLTSDVLPADPGLLSLDGSGTGQAYARNADGTLNSPDNPAKNGSSVTFYLTGIGVPGPACPYGQITPPDFVPSTTLDTTFGGSFPVSALPGFVCGIYAVNAQIPFMQIPPSSLQFRVFALPRGSVYSDASQILTIAVTP